MSDHITGCYQLPVQGTPSCCSMWGAVSLILQHYFTQKSRNESAVGVQELQHKIMKHWLPVCRFCWVSISVIQCQITDIMMKIFSCRTFYFDILINSNSRINVLYVQSLVLHCDQLIWCLLRFWHQNQSLESEKHYVVSSITRLSPQSCQTSQTLLKKIQSVHAYKCWHGPSDISEVCWIINVIMANSNLLIF